MTARLLEHLLCRNKWEQEQQDMTVAKHADMEINQLNVQHNGICQCYPS